MKEELKMRRRRTVPLGDHGRDLLSERSLNIIAILLMPVTLPLYVIRHPREAWQVFVHGD